MIEEMSRLGATQASINMTTNYLLDRTASISIGNTTVSTILTKGCPQGSGFGPTLWNIVVNEILSGYRDDYAHRIAYADDIVALVVADPRKELISKTEEHLKDLKEWSKKYGLTFSASKSMGMVLKGGLVSGFTIRFGEDKIKTTEKVKYLGITLDHDMEFKTQPQIITQKSTLEFSRIRGMMGNEWGVTYNSVFLLYKVIFIPRITYGAMIWMREWGSVLRTKINRAQRLPLLAVSGAYRTNSTDALHVITEILPLDLQILWEGNRQKTRIEEYSIDEQENLKELLQDSWQERWDASTKGRWTHKILPNVRFRLAIPLELNKRRVQFLSGHGDFKSKLFKLELAESPECSC